jgi:hypothetical protein
MAPEARNEIIEHGALDSILEDLSIAFPFSDFAAICDFAGSLISFEIEDYLTSIEAQFVRLADLEKQQPYPSKSYLEAVFVLTERQNFVDILSRLNVLDMFEIRQGWADPAWHLQVAAFLCTQSRLEQEQIQFDQCWRIAIAILNKFWRVEKVAEMTTRAFIGLVGCDVDIFVCGSIVPFVMGLFATASFEVKTNLAAAVSVAFCEATVEQYCTLIEYGLGGLLFESLPGVGFCGEAFGLILHGLRMYFQKLEIIPNREEILAEQVLTNQDFWSCMKEMEEDWMVNGFEVEAEWQGLVAIVRAIMKDPVIEPDRSERKEKKRK